MKKHKSLFFGLLLSFLILLLSGTSCSGRDHIVLNDDGSGSADVQIQLHPYFVAYLDDIVAGFSGAEAGTLPLFDLPTLRQSIQALPGVVLTRAELESRSSLSLGFTFSDAEKVFSAPAGAPGSAPAAPSPYALRRLADGSREASFTLSRETFTAVRAFVPMSQEQGVQTFGPQDPPYSPDEYVDLLGFLLEEYASYREIDTMIRSRRIDLEVAVQGTITWTEGFDSFSGGKAKASLSVIDLLTLEKPVVLKIRWK
jgi:hypothetical protein